MLRFHAHCPCTTPTITYSPYLRSTDHASRFTLTHSLTLSMLYSFTSRCLRRTMDPAPLDGILDLSMDSCTIHSPRPQPRPTHHLIYLVPLFTALSQA